MTSSPPGPRTVSPNAIEPAPSWVREWTWGDEFNRYEVAVRETELEWTWLGPRDLGGVTPQTFSAFLVEGPFEAGVPAEVLGRVRLAIAAKLGHRWPSFEREAEATRAAKAHPGGPPPAASAKTAPLAASERVVEAPAPSVGAGPSAVDEPRESLARTVLSGALVFIAGIVPSMLLKPVAPVLVVAEDPERSPQRLYAEGLMIAVGTWGAWALAVVVARVVAALRRRR